MTFQGMTLPGDDSGLTGRCLHCASAEWYENREEPLNGPSDSLGVADCALNGGFL